MGGSKPEIAWGSLRAGLANGGASAQRDSALGLLGPGLGREQGLQGESRPGRHAGRKDAACVVRGGEKVLGVKGIGLGSCGLHGIGRLGFLSALGLRRQVVLGR